MPLPIDIPFGYVVGRFVLAVGDTSNDPDFLPDAIPATGTIRFTPVVQKVVSTLDEPTTVLPKVVQTTLANGVLTDATGREGVWLVAGQYDVTFQMQQGVTLASIRVTVTAEHTEATPLDLSLVSPVPEPPAVKWVVNEQVYWETLEARDEAVAAAESATGAGGATDADIADLISSPSLTQTRLDERITAAGGTPLDGDLQWGGFGWTRRPYDGAPHFNGKWNATESGTWVDAAGHLHLKMARVGGVLQGVELISVRGGTNPVKWGYGKYRWVVETPLLGVYSPVVLGLFTYDGTFPPTHNEIDIEASGWGYGPQMWSGTYYRPGVGTEPENRSVIAHQPPATDGPTTHEFEWTPGKIVWRLWVGKDTTKAPDYEYTAVDGQPYVNNVISDTFTGTHVIPVPRDEELMMNLWVAQGLETYPPEDTPETEFVLSSFNFTPLAEMSYAAAGGGTEKVTVPCTLAGNTYTITAEKDANGIVHLYGEFSHSLASPVPTNTVIATLPEGFRPVSALRLNLGIYDNASGTLAAGITADYRATGKGDITIRGAWSAYSPISFTGISYKAA